MPESCRFLLQIRHPADLNRALLRTHAGSLLSMVTDDPSETTALVDLYRTLVTAFGLNASFDQNEFARVEVGLAAPSLSRLDEAVWMMRVPNPLLIDRWFPPKQRLQNGVAGPVHYFSTRGGTMIAYYHNLLLANRRWGHRTFLTEILTRLVERGHGALSDSEPYRGWVPRVSGKTLALLYVASEDKRPIAALKMLPFAGGLRRALLGFHEDGGSLNLAIFGQRSQPDQRSALSRQVVDRFARLPQTTVLAWTTKLDIRDGLSRRGDSAPFPSARRRFFSLLQAILAEDEAGTPPQTPVAPYTVLVWGQDLREGSSTPQVAVLIECAHPLEVRDRIDELAERILRIPRAIQSDGGDGVSVVKSTSHLGVDLHYISLKEYAARSTSLQARLLKNLEPTWAVWNGWLMVALSRDHLSRLLDAQLGLSPTLSHLPELQPLLRNPRGHALIAHLQSGIGSDLLEGWLQSEARGLASVLDPQWWDRWSVDRRMQRSPLGIGMSVQQHPGRVTVIHVYPDTVASGLLKPGDRIIGIDDHLLSLTTPNADLRRRWVTSVAVPGPTLRIRRGAKQMDVTLPKARVRETFPTVRVAPGDALRELTSLGRSLQYISFVVDSTQADQYSARLTLRFNRPE